MCGSEPHPSQLALHAHFDHMYPVYHHHHHPTNQPTNQLTTCCNTLFPYRSLPNYYVVLRTAIVLSVSLSVTVRKEFSIISCHINEPLGGGSNSTIRADSCYHIQSNSGHEQCLQHHSIHLDSLVVTLQDSLGGKTQKYFAANTSDCDSSSVCCTPFLSTQPEAQYFIHLSATDIFGRHTPIYYYPNKISESYIITWPSIHPIAFSCLYTTCRGYSCHYCKCTRSWAAVISTPYTLNLLCNCYMLYWCFHLQLDFHIIFSDMF